MRRVATCNEFFDILDQIKGGQWVTIGIVTGANLNDYPSIKRKNPLTNRMKGYPDHEAFGVPEEISALVKISSYNMHFSNRDKISKKYGEWKQSVNAIRRAYGAPEMGSRNGYKGTNGYGGGIETYNGDNESLKGHSYAPQNIFGVKPKSIVYAVNQDGHIIQALKPEQVRQYIKKYKEYSADAASYKDSGANALMKMGVEEEKIKEYLEKIAELKFSYVNFEANSILWIAASVNGEKIVYINDNLQRAVDGINIRPEDFRAIARERYQIDLANLQENRIRKTVVRLTESELREIVKESVNRCLKESSDLDADEIYGDRPAREQLQAKRDKMFRDDWELKNRRLRKKYPGRSQEWYEPMIDVFEGKKPKRKLQESFNNNQGYTHFAVNKATGKIVNGWDYSMEDPADLRNPSNKKDYFIVDLIENELNPKDYKVLTLKSLMRMGIDPDDNNNWANR